MSQRVNGIIHNIQRYSIHDGPGIRTTVFLKGCPLSCGWCHNPESRAEAPQLAFSANRCAACGACVTACRQGAIARRNGTSETDRSRCIVNGDCVEVCPTGARTLVGRVVSVHELVTEIERDAVFYDESGGGVTFSGGEPLAQPEFLAGCLRACRERGYHTAVDTSGYADPRVVRDIADLTDLFLYDLKLMDDVRHREHTGVSNAVILENLRTLCDRNRAIWVRVPLIPGITDDEQNLIATADFVATLTNAPPIQLLPYHRIGTDKYRRLGMVSSVDTIEPASDDQNAESARPFAQRGLNVRFGG